MKILNLNMTKKASLVAQKVKNLPAMQATQVRSLRKIPWMRAGQPHSSILTWRIPWTEEPAGLQAMELQSLTQLSD